MKVKANVVTRWEHPEARKKLNRLARELADFQSQLKGSQAKLLLGTSDVYKERLAQFFINQNAAIDLSITLVTQAQAGLLLSPEGWE